MSAPLPESPPPSAECPATEAPATEDPVPPPPAIIAKGLHAAGPDGDVFGPVDLRIDEGGLHILQGPSGSGRTTLLLALAGRFAVDAGTLAVHGDTRPARIRRTAAVAGFDGIDGIDEAVRVRAVVREQLAWNSPWYRITPKADDAAIARMLGPVFGDRPLPPASTYVQDLGELDLMLLRIALALAPAAHCAHPDPAVLIVDDLEQVRALPEQSELTWRLADLGRRITVVAAAINPLPEPAPPHALYRLLAAGQNGPADPAASPRKGA